MPMGIRFGNVFGIVFLVLSVAAAFSAALCLQQWAVLFQYQEFQALIEFVGVLPCDMRGTTGIPLFVCSVSQEDLNIGPAPGGGNPCFSNSIDPEVAQELRYGVLATDFFERHPLPTNESQALVDSFQHMVGNCTNIVVLPGAQVSFLDIFLFATPSQGSQRLCQRLSTSPRGSFVFASEFIAEKQAFLGAWIVLLLAFLLFAFLFFVAVKLAISKQALCCKNSKDDSEKRNPREIRFKSFRNRSRSRTRKVDIEKN